jgi:predicted transcriptional regulator
MSRSESKRSKTQLYATILEVLIGYPEGVKITRLSYGVGVPVDRLRGMVEELASFGLVRKLTDEDGTYFFATPRGLDFLDTYWKMQGFLAIFGENRAQESKKK